MGTERNELDELKGTNPFKLPEGYMEKLTDQIMSQLPEVQREEAPRISIFDRVRPWLYIAAIFIGSVFLFRGFLSLQNPVDGVSSANDPTYYTTFSNDSLHTESEEDLEYLEYLEYQYLNGAFSEMLANAE